MLSSVNAKISFASASATSAPRTLKISIVAAFDAVASLAPSNQAANAATLTGAARLSQNQDTGVSADLPRTLNDTRDVATIADELIKGPLAGADRSVVLKQLNRVMSEGNTNAATAGAVLSRNITGDAGSPFSIG